MLFDKTSSINGRQLLHALLESCTVLDGADQNNMHTNFVNDLLYRCLCLTRETQILSRRTQRVCYDSMCVTQLFSL